MSLRAEVGKILNLAWGLGFRVWGLGFRVQSLGFRVWGLGFRVSGLGCRAWGSGPGFILPARARQGHDHHTGVSFGSLGFRF